MVKCVRRIIFSQYEVSQYEQDFVPASTKMVLTEFHSSPLMLAVRLRGMRGKRGEQEGEREEVVLTFACKSLLCYFRYIFKYLVYVFN